MSCFSFERTFTNQLDGDHRTSCKKNADSSSEKPRWGFQPVQQVEMGNLIDRLIQYIMNHAANIDPNDNSV
jgi:hypothetical protein